MRRLLALLAGSLAVASCDRAPSVSLRALAHTKSIVNIDIRCDKDGVLADIDNWEARVPKTEPNAVWHIVKGAHTANISIVPKDSTWPFDDALPYTASDSDDVVLNRKNGKSAGKPSGYSIIATCKAPGSTVTHKVVIDPDMIVD